MFEFFASMFGYVLQFLYDLVNNYGLAIILFTILIKLILLPLSIKQQKSLKKSAKLQDKMKVIQVKYKNNEEKKNQEIMELYKTEKVNPLTGCLTAIVQMILFISIFYMVRSPITYMEKLPTEDITRYQQQLSEEGKLDKKSIYPEITLIKENEYLKEKNPEDSNVDKLNIDMNFLGLDLNKIPQQDMTDYTVYIIPVLYIISSFISIKMTTAMQQNQQKAGKKESLIDGSTGKELGIEETPDRNEMDVAMQTNKMMSWMIPIMSISVAFIAPLGLALYWLTSNVLMIIERLFLNRLIKTEEE